MPMLLDTLPTLPFPLGPAEQAAIDRCLHQVVADSRRNEAVDGFGRCADYAILGAKVLTQLLGHPYSPVAGGQIIDCGADEHIVIFPGREARRGINHLSQLIQYHCWIKSARGTREEIVDFTARHDALSARAFGKTFQGDPGRTYQWGWREDYDLPIPPALQNHPAARGRSGWLWEDSACTRLLRDYARENAAMYEELCARVLGMLTLELVAPKPQAKPSAPLMVMASAPRPTALPFARKAVARAFETSELTSSSVL
ncbi:hypothetical protein [Massilia sp. TS11]|uniref:hypothetical protein n=1 Tax=Massilia sp. TS11 TaxID=2908003 RepID=UPI001ED9FAE3|nr:hypothetical protein [Massilia sp. TS11]MCG2583173.1 hypothetical protein [Massilia sp. TS11]